MCDQLTASSPPISWVCKTRCDQIDRELARAMAAAGCTSVFFGAQSGSAAVLERIGKGITPHDIGTAARTAHEAGLKVHVHLMVGFPGETVEDLGATSALMERLIASIA